MSGFGQAIRESFSWRVTRAEKKGYRDALTLFFGALLGTNLSVTEKLSLPHYGTLIALLAALIMGIQLISSGRNRAYILTQGILFTALLAWLDRTGALRPPELPFDAYARLRMTIGIWVASAVLVELLPVRRAEPDDQRIR
jgi:hypothetical protein